MSSEQKEEPKLYECQECGKRFFGMPQLAGHIGKAHSQKADKADKAEKDRDYVTHDELMVFADSLEKAFRQAAPTPPTLAPAANSNPPTVKLGHFIVREKPDGTYDMFCPTCGTAEWSRPLPQKVVKEVEKEEVEVVPPGYIPAPKGGEDWLRVLSLKHADGKGPEECPECAKALMTWFNQNRQKLERAARVAR